MAPLAPLATSMVCAAAFGKTVSERKVVRPLQQSCFDLASQNVRSFNRLIGRQHQMQ